MLKTEERNPRTKHIDAMTPSEMVRVIQDENMNAVRSIEPQLENIALAIDKISERMSRGGRLFYVGCGTSGRLGVLDASECPPTFGVSAELVVGIIAGGDRALRSAVEGAEDDRMAGIADIRGHSLTELDSVVGISVAGGARYVLGAMEVARACGALTVALTCNADGALTSCTDITICTDTGAEVVTGSTRMKAGSAHKMVLNMISTGVMIRLGNVYENLMINLRPSNIKLRDRMIRIVSELADVPYADAERMLTENGFSIRRILEAVGAP